MSAATETTVLDPEAVHSLHDRALEVVRAVMQPALLEEARQLLNAAGIGQARGELARLRKATLEAPDAVSNVRTALVSMQERERQLREQYEAAVAEAEWALDGRFVTEGNKTFLLTWNREADVDAVEAEAKGWKKVDTARGPAWEERRQMTADERAAWRKRSALESRSVQPFLSDLRGAEHAVALAKVDVDTAENRWQATRAVLAAAATDLEAACAEVACLARALGGGS